MLFCTFAIFKLQAEGGTTGDLTWDYSNSVLTISGTGAMPDYNYNDELPWVDYLDVIDTVFIGSGVTSIGKRAFNSCNMRFINIPNGVASIGAEAFSSCTVLPSITLPSSVTHIGNDAFYHCTSLVSINVASTNPSFSSEGGVLFNKNKTTLKVYPPAKPGSAYTIPISVTSIDNYAFYSCFLLTSITISYNVTSIGRSVFEGCTGLTSINIPSNVMVIGQYAFYNCIGLTSINVATDNRYFTSENGVLFNKAKTELVAYPPAKSGTAYNIPHSVTEIYKAAFYRCVGLNSITIPHSVTFIGNAAFSRCSGLNSITVLNLNPDSITLEYAIFNVVNTAACTLYVPTSSVTLFEAANTWKNFNIMGGGHLITATSGNPMHGHTTGCGLYEEGTPVSILAIPNSGYVFKNWTINNITASSTANPYTFTATANTELVAYFEEGESGFEDIETLSVKFLLYPNPTQSSITISPSESIQNVEIYNLAGLLLGAYSQTVINIAHLPAGVYFVKIITKNGNVTKRVVRN